MLIAHHLLTAPRLPSRTALPPHRTQLRVPAKPALQPRLPRWWCWLAGAALPALGASHG